MASHFSLDDTHVDDLLRLMVQAGGTELRLAVERPPLIVEQAVERLVSTERLLPAHAERLCYDVLTDAQIAECEAQGELYFAYPLPRCGQFRAHLTHTPAGLAATFQRV